MLADFWLLSSVQWNDTIIIFINWITLWANYVHCEIIILSVSEVRMGPRYCIWNITLLTCGKGSSNDTNKHWSKLEQRIHSCIRNTINRLPNQEEVQQLPYGPWSRRYLFTWDTLEFVIATWKPNFFQLKKIQSSNYNKNQIAIILPLSLSWCQICHWAQIQNLIPLAHPNPYHNLYQYQYHLYLSGNIN